MMDGLETFGESSVHSSLHLAAAYGHMDIVELLISHGAFVDSRDEWQRTPLQRWEKCTVILSRDQCQVSKQDKKKTLFIERWFGFFNWVDNVHRPPWRVSKTDVLSVSPSLSERLFVVAIRFLHQKFKIIKRQDVKFMCPNFWATRKSNSFIIFSIVIVAWAELLNLTVWTPSSSCWITERTLTPRTTKTALRSFWQWSEAGPELRSNF